LNEIGEFIDWWVNSRASQAKLCSTKLMIVTEHYAKIKYEIYIIQSCTTLYCIRL